MALRGVLAKLGNISNSSSSHSYERVAAAIGLAVPYPAAAASFSPPAYPFPLYESRIPIIPLTTQTNKRQDYLVDLGGLRPARFALQEFNKLKKAQLHLVRVVKYVRVDNADGLDGFDPDSCYCWYALIFEAVDAAGVLKHYQASVRIDDLTEGLWLEELCIFKPQFGELRRIQLYHHLDNFFDGAYTKYFEDEKSTHEEKVNSADEDVNSTDEEDVNSTDEEKFISMINEEDWNWTDEEYCSTDEECA